VYLVAGERTIATQPNAITCLRGVLERRPEIAVVRIRYRRLDVAHSEALTITSAAARRVVR
jgi:hypothetical protein